MRSLPLTLFACLFTTTAVADKSPGQPAPTPPVLTSTDIAIAPVAWSQVENASGHLAFVQALTAYALTAPVEEFPAALAAVERWPQLPAPAPFAARFPNEPDERITRARRILAQAFTTRATDSAIAYHSSHPASDSDVLIHFRPVFFATLTRLDSARARAELLKIPTGDDRQQAAAAFVSALSRTAPFAALSALSELNITDTSAIAAVFAAAARLDPPKALASLSSVTDDRLRATARESILTEWILNSPDAPLAWITVHIPLSDRPSLLDAVLPQVGARNFPLLASIEEKTRDPLIQAAATRAIGLLLINQPVRYAWDRVLSRGWTGVSREPPTDAPAVARTLHDLVLFASTQPPDQVRQFFRSLPPGYGEDTAHAAEIMKAWTLADPDGALAWADKLPAGDVKIKALAQGQSMLVALDPELAFARLRNLPPSETLNALATVTFFELAKKDLRRAVTQMPFRDNVFYGHLYAMAAISQVASDYAPDTRVELIHDPTTPETFTAIFASDWLFDEPADALAWYLAQPAGPIKTYLQSSASFAFARSDPQRAIDFASQMPLGSERTALIEALINNHTVEQPGSVLALINSLPISGERTLLRTKALQELAKADPSGTSAQLDSGALGPINPQAINTIVSQWAKDSAADSARWLSVHLLPVQNHPDLINNAVDQVARYYAQQDPAAALVWAEALTDPAASQKATATAIETIGKSSRDLSLRLLAASTLPENQKTELASRLRK